MPCRDGGPPDDSRLVSTSTKTAPADLLCEAMTVIEWNNPSLLQKVSDELRAWWRNHKVNEERRVRGEAAAKLTDRERLALGINFDGSPRK